MLESVCEPDAAAAAAVRRQYPSVHVVSRYDDLLSSALDAVVIAAPARLHAEMCLAALAAGKHVFVEKPLALTVASGERVADAVEASGRVVFVGHLLLYHPGVKRLQSLVAEGAIGRVWHVRSRRLSLGKLRDHENVWWSFAPHDVALMLALMGEEPCAVVAAQSAPVTAGLSAVAYADFEFSNGRSAHVEVCWLDPEKSARLDVFGDRGVLTLQDARSKSSLRLRRFSVGTAPNGMRSVARGDETEIEFEETEPLRAEILAFVEAVTTQRPFPTSARQGVAVLRALSMADRALPRQDPLQALA